MSLWKIAGAAAATVLAGIAAAGPQQGRAPAGAVKRGEYLVTVSGCNDCHTPWKMGAGGPEPDFTRRLSGHPEPLEMPPAPELGGGPWTIAAAGTMTAWAGPWGVSFAANLTPDPETGLGRWTERQFVAAMRTGRHEGSGRRILPPMPVPNVAAMSDADLKAVFAYLRSIPAIRNRVPEPLPPASAHAAGASGSTGTR